MTAIATDSRLEREVGLPKEIKIDLTVRDPEIVLELWQRQQTDERTRFALSALRLGVLALRQASGAIDSATVRQEGERLVGSIRELLAERSTQMIDGLSGTLKQYFDPSDGQLPQRLERLLRKDGDLEGLLKRHLGDDGSTMARTLAKHVGETSPLLRMLSPNQGDGILKAITDIIVQALQQQRDYVLRQFSLDHPESALARLVTKITDANGKFRTDLSEDLSRLSAEFSLDNEEGALARLVRQVDRAQRSIVEQFSSDNEDSALSRMSKLLEATNETVRASLTLDDENSPLSVLRRELMLVLKNLNESNASFQTEVKATLEAFKARREEAGRSVVHGGEFQDAVGSALQHETQRLGDIFEDVGTTAGNIPRCKVGDHLLTLGPESAAPGARIVCEAKADKTYDLRAALEEINTARENRQAQAGIFVLASDSAPEGFEPLTRIGNDIVVVWDPNDPTTDVYLKGALSVARAVVVRQEQASAKAQADFQQIESAIHRISSDAKVMHEIITFANTAKTSSQKIIDKTERCKRRSKSAAGGGAE